MPVLNQEILINPELSHPCNPLLTVILLVFICDVVLCVLSNFAIIFWLRLCGGLVLGPCIVVGFLGVLSNCQASC